MRSSQQWEEWLNIKRGIYGEEKSDDLDWQMQ
jgi:hypothetical protein